MKIAGQEVKPGESKVIRANIARLPSHTDIDLIVHVNRSKKPGPTVLLSGGLHGDEINGVEVVRRIIDEGLNEPKIGTIICLPIINIYGFINFSRYVPDGKDINRSFPGSKTGSLAARVANFLTKSILPAIDYGFDFHTGGDNRANFPQVRANFRDEKAKKLALATNAPFIMDSPLIAKSLRSTANKMGKSVLVYEGGEAMRINDLAVDEGTKCVKNFLGHLKMIDHDMPEPSGIIIKESNWVRAKHSGIFHSSVELGQIIEKNDIIGQITDPFGDFQKKITAQSNGYIIGLNNTPIVHQGDALFHVGSE